MEKMQTIDLSLLKNTIKNLSIKSSENFEEVPLPDEPEYKSNKAEKTLKQQTKLNSNSLTSTFEESQLIKEEIIE